jgi:chemotaxis protein CheD
MTCATLSPPTVCQAGMGQIAQAAAPALLTTVLGSCIGLAIYHPRSRHGLLAHIVLPASGGRSTPPGKFADVAVPYMLQQLAQLGLCDGTLVVKLAGGANMFGLPAGPMQVGECNITAVEAALAKAKLKVAARHIGGCKGRRVTFDCQTGLYKIEVVGAEIITL